MTHPHDPQTNPQALVEALERIRKFVDDYKAPWGAWKTVWWEDEVSDQAAFSDDNALMHVANLASAALSLVRKQIAENP